MSIATHPTRQGHRLFQSRVGPARFERRPAIVKLRELLVGRRGEAPLVLPYILPSFKRALALSNTATLLAKRPPHDNTSHRFGIPVLAILDSSCSL